MCYLTQSVGPWAAVGWTLMVALKGGAVLLGIWAFSRSGRHTHEENGAWAIARERYARGEVSKEEFDRIKKGLS